MQIAVRTAQKAEPWFGFMRWWFFPVQTFLWAKGWTVLRWRQVDLKVRGEGRDWPADAEITIGLKRLDNIQACIECVPKDNIPGHLIEAGVWRVGVLKAHGDPKRLVRAADSFEGLPKPKAGAYWRRQT